MQSSRPAARNFLRSPVSGAEGVRAGIYQERKERRTFHANGDGTFVVDGDTISLRRLMEDKLPSGV
jgi:hypothetical protein